MNSIMWAKLKEYILTKNSHGKNEILNEMVKIEISFANEKLGINVPMCNHQWTFDSTKNDGRKFCSICKKYLDGGGFKQC